MTQVDKDQYFRNIGMINDDPVMCSEQQYRELVPEGFELGQRVTVRLDGVVIAATKSGSEGMVAVTTPFGVIYTWPPYVKGVDRGRDDGE